MDGRLLPLRLQKCVAASIQHVALSLICEEKASIPRYTSLKFA